MVNGDRLTCIRDVAVRDFRNKTGTSEMPGVFLSLSAYGGNR